MMPEKYFCYELIKYFRPIWYFHLIPNNKQKSVWIDFDHLSNEEKEMICYDKGYSSTFLCQWDASFQALMQGLICKEQNYIQPDIINIYPTDIYRFIRKYQKKIWVYSIFFHRLFSLFNPINEFIGLWKTRGIEKINIFNKYYNYDAYDNYESLFIKNNSLVSIIIPTLNRYQALRDLLQDLEEQTYKNFEVIIIDQSKPFQENIYNNTNIHIHLIRQDEAALWKARNCGIRSAKSDYILFLDDDSSLAPDWILQHLKCIDFFESDISSGVSISIIGSKVPENYYYFRHSDQIDTGNVLIKRGVFIKCGLFDEQFEKMRMGDAEFGARAYLNGFKNISNPKAYRKHLKMAKGGLRDMGHWDGYRPKNIFSPRPIPSVLYYYRKYWGPKAAVFDTIYSLPFSFCPYILKGKKVGVVISIILFLLLFPLIVVQWIVSWVQATLMLKRGPKISKL